MGMPNFTVVRGYCDGSRWRFDSSNARELCTGVRLCSNESFTNYNHGPHSSHVL